MSQVEQRDIRNLSQTEPKDIRDLSQSPSTCGYVMIREINGTDKQPKEIKTKRLRITDQQQRAAMHAN